LFGIDKPPNTSTDSLFDKMAEYDPGFGAEELHRLYADCPNHDYYFEVLTREIAHVPSVGCVHDGIFIGSAFTARRREMLVTLGITTS
jgi:hypothetical protein